MGEPTGSSHPEGPPPSAPSRPATMSAGAAHPEPGSGPGRADDPDGWAASETMPIRTVLRPEPPAPGPVRRDAGPAAAAGNSRPTGNAHHAPWRPGAAPLDEDPGSHRPGPAPRPPGPRPVRTESAGPVPPEQAGPDPSAEPSTGGRSPYEIVPTPAHGLPPVPGRPRTYGAPPPPAPPAVPPGPPPPAEPPHREPLAVAYRVPARGTLAGLHVEQLVLWQLVVLGVVVVQDQPPSVLVPAGVVGAVVLALTATRFRGQWTHRSLLHRLRLWRRARASARTDALPPLVIQDARLGRVRRLGTVFDGTGWSSAVRLAPGGPGGDLPLVALVRAAERFLADVEHDFAEVRIVHTLVPAGRTARTRSRAGMVEDRELPPLVAQTWMTCRVHGIDGRRSDRPVPDLLQVRRDLRRCVDGVLANLAEDGIDAHALATRQLYDDCVLSAGGRHEGPEPVAVPGETSTDVERRPAAAAARPGGRDEQRSAECEAVEVDHATDLGDSVHATLALVEWPDEGFARWLRTLSRVRARAVSLVVTLGRSTEPGLEAGIVVRHTTGSAAESARVGRALREHAEDAGARLHRTDARSHESLLATLPLGSSAAHRLLGPATRHLVEPEADAELPPRASGVCIGHDPAGTPVPVRLVGPEPGWTAVLGGTEVGAVVVASALAGQLRVQVVTPQPGVWEQAFHGYGPAGRLEVRALAPDRAPAAFPAAPGILLIDDYGAGEVLRPPLRAWQAGVCRIDPGRDDVDGLLAGVSRVIAVRCSEDRARGVCAALGLGDGEVEPFVTAPDGVVTVADARGAAHVELDAALISELGLRVTRPPAAGRIVDGPMAVG